MHPNDAGPIHPTRDAALARYFTRLAELDPGERERAQGVFELAIGKGKSMHEAADLAVAAVAPQILPPAGFVEVELHSREPGAVAATRATILSFPKGEWHEESGRYFVPAGFVAWAAERQGYVRRIVR